MSVSLVVSEDWMSKIIAYLNNTHQCDDEAWLTRMNQRARQYKLINENYIKREYVIHF